MKLEWNTELAMLQLVVLPSVDKVKSLLGEGSREEAQRIAAKDILGLLMPYRDMEKEKYENSPDNLKSAPNVVRMKENGELMDAAISLLYDEEARNLLPCEAWNLDAVSSLVIEMIQS